MAAIGREVGYSHKAFRGEDFSFLELAGKDLSHSVFENCCFDHADLSYADCSNSVFTGSTFRLTNCYHTNFIDSKMAGTVFAPKDAYGMKVSLTCETFRGMQVSQLWFFALLYFAGLTRSSELTDKENLREKLIAVIGAKRWGRMTQLFRTREL